MKKRNKSKSKFPPNPLILKEAAKKGNLGQGLKALDSIWKRGVIPRDLEQHFYLTWFAYENGNVRRLAETIGMHRNTLVLNYRVKVKHVSTLKLRRLLSEVRKTHPKKSFHEQLFRFYHRVFKEPWFLSRENEALANLWLMGVDRKTVRAQYVLWALRSGITLAEIARKMKRETSSVHRFRVYATRPGSPAQKWLAPLKATKAEWYPPGLRGRKKKRR